VELRALLAWRCSWVGARSASNVSRCWRTSFADRAWQSDGLVISATGLGAAVGVPLVAFLLEAAVGLPFYVMGAASLGVWILFWSGCPESVQFGPIPHVFSHYREVGARRRSGMCCRQTLQQRSLWARLATWRPISCRLPPARGDTVLPLALAGSGVIVGGFLGRAGSRTTIVASCSLPVCVGGGCSRPSSHGAGVAWALSHGLWAAGLIRISSAVDPMLLRSGRERRATAMGLFAVSNQLGAFGAIAWGLHASPWVGSPWWDCCGLGVGGTPPLVIRLKIQDSPAFLAQMAYGKAQLPRN